jgi:predicted PurR-regulated permease PerM
MESLMLKTGNKLFITLFVLLTGGLLYLLAPILTPFLMGALLAYLVNPLVKQLMRLHLPRLLSVIIIFSLLFSLLTLLILSLIQPIQNQIQNLIDTIPAIIDWEQNTLMPWLSSQLGIHEANVKTTLVENLSKTGDSTGKFLNTILHSGFILVEWLINLILIPVVTFYLLLDWNQVIKKTRHLLPRRIEPVVVKLTKECNSVLSAFFRGQLIVILVLSLIYSAGLTLIGLRIGLILGLISGIISIVPYLGLVIGITSASIAAFVQFGNFTSVAFVGLVFVLGHLLEHLYLTPKLVGNRIGLHPVAVIFAVLAGGKLFGLLGIVLALPIAAVIRVWLRFLIKHYHESALYQ